jgi:hypothetical protein
MASSPLHLLLAHADDGTPALGDGIADEAVQRASAPSKLPDARTLRNRGADPSDLAAQRWSLIVPDGALGKRLESLVRPLVDRRRDQQGGRAVRVYRVPAGLDSAQAARWNREVYLDEATRESDLPYYQLILGDLDQVSLAVQQVQMIDGAVGRIAFGDDQSYEAYVDKLLRWEDQPAAIEQARSVFFTAHDGSAATTLGYQALVSPALALAHKDQGAGDYAASEIIELGGPGRAPSADSLFAACAAPDPAVLFSMSHGIGAPRAGWSSSADQRRLQGAISLGAGAAITGSELAAQRFLPGGVWFMFACYGAGTPDTSVYRPWLERLSQLGAYGGQPDAALRGLPRPGERPFIANLPAAALANPDGPIGFIGHVDLAWSYSFLDLDASTGPKNRLRRFTSLLGYALRSHRIGIAFRELANCAIAADTELLTIYGRQAAQRGAELAPAERTRLGHLWMLRQDLLGYVLLGDPAARLPLAQAQPAPQRSAPRRPTPDQLFPFASAAPPSAAPPPAAPPPAAPPPAAPPPAAPPPAAPPPAAPPPAAPPPAAPPSAAPSAGSSPAPAQAELAIELLEHAIGQLIAGLGDPAVIARALGIALPELLRLTALYSAAGRAALDRAR